MIALIIIGSIILLILIRVKLIYYFRKLEYSDWKVGDVIVLNLNARLELKTNVVTLKGWTPNHVYIGINNETREINYSDVDTNKSAKWRRVYDDCKETMGDEPNFTPIVTIKSNNDTDSTGGMIYGQPIETLNETMCQVYLKKAIEEENFEVAELLRKRLETNFR